MIVGFRQAGESQQDKEGGEEGVFVFSWSSMGFSLKINSSLVVEKASHPVLLSVWDSIKHARRDFQADSMNVNFNLH